MHVVVVTSSFPRSAGDASGHFVLAEVEQLVEAGHRVTLLAPGERLVAVPGVRALPFGAERASGWPGIMPRLRERPLGAIELAAAAARARRLLRGIPRADRLIAHWLLPCGWPIATAVDLPCEVVVHGSDLRLLARLPAAVRRHVLRPLIARGARFRCVSDELRRTLLAAGGAELAERSWVEPCAVSIGAVPARDAARAELGLDPERRLAVIVARLVPGKRVQVALAAAELVPGLDTVVVGDGPARSELERRFPCVTFTGQLPRPMALRWLRAADVVLSASRAEGAPSAIREARALGVPVVTTPCGDVARWAARDPELHVTRALPQR